MKSLNVFVSIFMTTSLIVSSCGNEGAKNEVALQKINDQSSNYKEVKIGKQLWMAENLNVDKFCNGDPIPHAKTVEEWENAKENGKPAWCYYDNDLANGEKYGKLYNWYAVNDPRGLAPKNWHVPTKNEWLVLINHLGGQNEAGIKMKSKSGWSNTDWCKNGNGNNESGFSGLPGGVIYSYKDKNNEGGFEYIGYLGCWWSSSVNNSYYEGFTWRSSLGFDRIVCGMGSDEQSSGFSVRCLKD